MRWGGSKLVAAAVAAVLAVVVAGCSGSETVAGENSGSSSTEATTPTTEAAVEARASEGCGTPPAVTATDDQIGDVALTFEIDGAERTYRLGVPATYDPEVPAPLVLNLHGATSNANQQSAYSQLSAKGTDRGYIVVTPDANAGMWQLAGTGTDDAFLTALLDDIAANYCIGLDRVHAAGISLGAWKASITACTHPDRFASIALVAEEVAPPDCAMPVVAFHGTADRVVPYGAGADEGIVVTNNNAALPGVEVNMPRWARQGGCSEEYEVERIEPDVEHWIFKDCPEGMDVELYSIKGGGHTWPGSPVALPGNPTTTTIDATEIALDWFDAHPRRS